MEWIDDVARVVDRHPDQEMAGKGQALGVPTLGARDVQVEDRQRHRQTLAPLDDARQIGILQVVVGLAVAAIGISTRDHVGQPFGRGAAPAHEIGQIGRHARHVLAQRRKADRPAALQGTHRQRRLEQVYAPAVACAEVAQPCEFVTRHVSLRCPPHIG